ncbi:ubiquitin-conjugating enzyme E2 32-like, partial [Cucurbita maxima]|uniref:Ubiquitin-conjugating enzyme E2 32-like n=1 Tax=Cucurbita maxima TaxID=3661 RepID=A0A6J1IK79_CUCMA
MPTNPNGALGSLDYKKEERRVLAIKSREAAPKSSTPERQKLIDEIHEYLLSKVPPAPQLSSADDSKEKPANKEADVEVTSEATEPAATGEEQQNPPVSDRIVEEAIPEETSINANLQQEAAREAPSGRPAL